MPTENKNNKLMAEYRGKLLTDMSKDELIDALYEMGRLLIEQSEQHMKDLEVFV